MLACLIESRFIYWVLLFLGVAALDLLIAVLTWRKKQILSNSICNLLLAAMMTTVFYAGAISFENYRVSSVFSSLYFIGVDGILSCMLVFVAQFTERKKRGKLIPIVDRLGRIWVLVDCVVLLVNPFWEIAMTYVPLEVNGHLIYKYDAHLLYNIHLLMCYLLIVLVVAALVHKMTRTPAMYRRKYSTVLFVFVFDVVLNVFYLAGADMFLLDISVLFYSLAGILIYHAVFSSVPKSLLITTRNYIMENLDTPLVVFDYQDRIIDSNQSARALFPELTPTQQNSTSAVHVPTYFTQRGFPPFYEDKIQFEWKYRQSAEERIYHCQRHDFKDEKDRLIGRMLMMQDISYRKDTITGLDLTPGLYRHISLLEKEKNYPIQILAINVNGLGLINSALGHEKGNQVMEQSARIMRSVLSKDHYMAKLEDGTLIALLLRTDASQAAMYGDKIRSAVAKDNTLGFRFDIEYGVSEVTAAKSDLFEALHEAQMSMKNRKLLSDSSHESSIITSLLQTLLESDYETEAHVSRTKQASRRIAEALELTDRETSELALMCMLHDIGKVGIPQEILLKPGKLDADEWEIMKTHTDKGYRIAMASPELQGISRMVLHHHERWDGMGYPGRLKGEEIPLLSRIITVLDSFDVMTHDRPYHKAISLQEAKEELIRCSGTQFDPEIVDVFLKIADEVYQSGETVATK